MFLLSLQTFHLTRMNDVKDGKEWLKTGFPIWVDTGVMYQFRSLYLYFSKEEIISLKKKET